MFPFRLMAFPVRVNGANAVASKTIPPNDVFAAKLLLGEMRVVPAKSRISPAAGGRPPSQFTVFQLLSPPPPLHVLVAAWAIEMQTEIAIVARAKLENRRMSFLVVCVMDKPSHRAVDPVSRRP